MPCSQKRGKRHIELQNTHPDTPLFCGTFLHPCRRTLTPWNRHPPPAGGALPHTPTAGGAYSLPNGRGIPPTYAGGACRFLTPAHPRQAPCRHPAHPGQGQATTTRRRICRTLQSETSCFKLARIDSTTRRRRKMLRLAPLLAPCGRFSPGRGNYTRRHTYPPCRRSYALTHAPPCAMIAPNAPPPKSPFFAPGVA